MLSAANQTRRDVMLLAWSKFRYERRRATGFTFAAALRHAWAWIKGEAVRVAAKATRDTMPARRVVHLRSVLRSPIDRAQAGQAHAGARAFKAAYTTTQFGG